MYISISWGKFQLWQTRLFHVEHLLLNAPLIQYEAKGGDTMPNWTKEQEQAIYADNAQLLVSAAAGSGKTAVLIERILRLLGEGAQLNRMVIVTFTKAAAAQLREKLNRRLFDDAAEGDPIAAEQLALLPVTQIGTIHSFCGAILKEQFQVVGLDPGSRQIDNATRDKLMEKALNDSLDAFFESPTEAFSALSAAFSDKDIQEMVSSLYGFMMSLKDPFEWLLKQEGQNYDSQSLAVHPYMAVLLNHCRIQLEGLEKELDKLFDAMKSPYANAKWLNTLTSDRLCFDRLKTAADSGYDALAQEADLVFEKAPGIRGLEDKEAAWNEGMKKRREAFKKALIKAVKEIPDDLSKSAADMNRMQPCVKGLVEITLKFDARFTELKQAENGMDFNDLIHLTLKVLKDDEARETIQNQYDHLFVDEYQDVGDAEEGIFQAIRHEKSCLFMVGDVKQSIYRFRLCDPTLFLTKQETFSSEEDAACRKIFLNKNFRSEPAVLETVNRVFETVMTKKVTELDYDAEAHLYPGREENRCDRAQLVILPGERQADEEGNRLKKTHAEFETLKRLILEQRETLVYDRETGKMRLTRFRDMAILLPKAKGVGPDLAAALKECGIPAYADSDENYFDLPEVQRMMALLHVLNNPRDDVAFLTVLKLPLFHFTDAELAETRLQSVKKGASFYTCFLKQAKEESALGKKALKALERLELWRFRVAHVPLCQMVWEVMKESGLYLYAGTQAGGNVRQGNLRLLCEHAANYEAVGHGGLDGFLRLGITSGDEGDSKTAKALSPKDDLVRIMTIHKSKGLEFPVVYMMGLGDALHRPERRKLRPHKTLGIGIPYVAPELSITRKTLAQTAITLQGILDDKAERARLLYVGMTRAVEKLVMLGASSKIPADEWALEGAYGVFAAKSYLDWLCIVNNVYKEIYEQVKNGLSTSFQQSDTPYDIKVLEAFEQQAVENDNSLSTGLSTLIHSGKPEMDTAVTRRLNRAFFKNTDLMPLKTSVSAISKKATWSAQEETVETKGMEADAVPPLTMSDLPGMPAFMKEKALSAADRGSAVHMALSQLTFKGDIAEEVAAMARKGLLTEAQRRETPLEWLENFMRSALCQRMLKARRVKREWAFTYRLYPDKKTLVQGVMDLCFLEEDGWVLCDYKTDRTCDAETLRERYEKQVAIYRKALEALSGIPVKEAWLFALRSGEAIEMKAEVQG